MKCRYCKREGFGGVGGLASPMLADLESDFACWRRKCQRLYTMEALSYRTWFEHYVMPKVRALAKRRRVCSGCGVRAAQPNSKRSHLSGGRCGVCTKWRTHGFFMSWWDEIEKIALRLWKRQRRQQR